MAELSSLWPDMAPGYSPPLKSGHADKAERAERAERKAKVGRHGPAGIGHDPVCDLYTNGYSDVDVMDMYTPADVVNSSDTWPPPNKAGGDSSQELPGYDRGTQASPYNTSGRDERQGMQGSGRDHQGSRHGGRQGDQVASPDDGPWNSGEYVGQSFDVLQAAYPQVEMSMHPWAETMPQQQPQQLPQQQSQQQSQQQPQQQSRSPNQSRAKQQRESRGSSQQSPAQSPGRSPPQSRSPSPPPSPRKRHPPPKRVSSPRKSRPKGWIIDMSVYIISGVVLIFILESFIKLGALRLGCRAM